MNERETKMAKTMVQLWASFTRSGVPRADSIPYWRPVDSKDHLNKLKKMKNKFLFYVLNIRTLRAVPSNRRSQRAAQLLSGRISGDFGEVSPVK